MINRTWIKCRACNKPITARIQIGHEQEQPINFSCPHCGTEVRLTLLLDEPPRIKIRWDDNAEAGTEEGTIINIGVGFVIPKEKLHEDMYFPSFSLPKPNLEVTPTNRCDEGKVIIDTSVALGALPRAADYWKIIQRALRFNRTGQLDNLNTQLQLFWEGGRVDDKTLDNALFVFLIRFMSPNGQALLEPLGRAVQKARSVNQSEFEKFIFHYDADLKEERFESYSDIFSEYFRAYAEFNQTLVYVRNGLSLPHNAIATSSNFELTRMFYGNAFEVLGSHLDVPAAINNIIHGRAFDQMNSMSLSQFRTINKAGRTKCFEDNIELSWLVTEYDSVVRNASHHRWFKLDEARIQISFRSGGTGAIHTMSYADYLFRCNRLIIQLMALCCLELMLLSSEGKLL